MAPVDRPPEALPVVDALSPDGTYTELESRFRRTQRAIAVDFRQLVGPITNNCRATHHLHPYPAKLIPHIPNFFLSVNRLSEPDDRVLDPFCGSGTVLLEAILKGRVAFGADSNPLARLVARVKTTPPDSSRLSHATRRLFQRIRDRRAGELPSVVNIDHWFPPHVLKQLARVRAGIEATRSPEIRDFFRVSFSNCVRQVSFADPRLSVPVRLRWNQYPLGHWYRSKANARLRELSTVNAIHVFRDIVMHSIRRMRAFTQRLPEGAEAWIIWSDARRLTEDWTSNGVQPESINLILTSPPYLGAQKYKTPGQRISCRGVDEVMRNHLRNGLYSECQLIRSTDGARPGFFADTPTTTDPTTCSRFPIPHRPNNQAESSQNEDVFPNLPANNAFAPFWNREPSSAGRSSFAVSSTSTADSWTVWAPRP